VCCFGHALVPSVCLSLCLSVSSIDFGYHGSVCLSRLILARLDSVSQIRTHDLENTKSGLSTMILNSLLAFGNRWLYPK
jgi:hypothetical protein